MLGAWELGIGSCHASVYDEPRVRGLLAYPPQMTCDLVVSFGYPADLSSLAPPGSRGGRKALGDLRHEERFGGETEYIRRTTGPTHSRGTERPSTGVSMGRPGGGFR